LKGSSVTIQRELANNIDWSRSLVGIKGVRGVGKTTFLLDYLKKFHGNDNSALYINLNSFYFTKQKISSFANKFAKRGGKLLLLDQIHKYPEWSKDLRKCIDEIPELKIIFTTSPVLQTTKYNHILNNAASIYYLEGLSFREYINYQAEKNFRLYTLEEILKNHDVIVSEIVAQIEPLTYFSDYLKQGYFPYFIGKHNFYNDILLKNVNLALEVDIPYINKIELKYLPKLRKLLYIIASETSFTPNISKLATAIGTSRATIMNYLQYLKNARLIHLLYENDDDDRMKKPDRIYMHNTNLQHAIASQNTDSLNLMHTFFYNQVGYRHKLNSVPKIDFCVDGKYNFTIEKSATDIYVLHDVVETGENKRIPLWLFGFLY
jgi:predicted AAA+ superfamily ATPase